MQYRGSGAPQPPQDGLILRQGDLTLQEATLDPLNGRWLLVLAAVRRALAIRQPIRASRRIVQPTAHFGITIGTAILSYAKHGKFPALTQAAGAESQRKKRPFRPNDIAVIPVPRLQWIMG